MPSLADLPALDSAAPGPDAGAPMAASAADSAPPPALPAPFDDVIQGQIPAVLIPPVPKDGKPTKVHEFVVDNMGEMLSGGLDYRELKDTSLVLYNPALLPPKELEKAIKDGTIHKIAAVVTKIGDADAPAPTGSAAPAGKLAEAPPPAAPAPAASAPPAPPPPNVSVPGVAGARLRTLGATKQVSPIMPSPVPGRLAQRAV